jgi:hypothetical protein
MAKYWASINIFTSNSMHVFSLGIELLSFFIRYVHFEHSAQHQADELETV